MKLKSMNDDVSVDKSLLIPAIRIPLLLQRVREISRFLWADMSPEGNRGMRFDSSREKSAYPCGRKAQSVPWQLNIEILQDMMGRGADPENTQGYACSDRE